MRGIVYGATGAVAALCLHHGKPQHVAVGPFDRPVTVTRVVNERQTTLAEQELAKTLFMECRSCDKAAMRAVANTAWHRADGDPKRLLDVLWRPSAFSCNNVGDRNVLAWRAAVAHPERHPADAAALKLAQRIAWLTVRGRLADNVPGADHYFAASMPKPPSWAAHMVLIAQVGPHKFFKDQPNGKPQVSRADHNSDHHPHAEQHGARALQHELARAGDRSRKAGRGGSQGAGHPQRAAPVRLAHVRSVDRGAARGTHAPVGHARSRVTGTIHFA